MLKKIKDLNPGQCFMFEGREYRFVLVANMAGFFGLDILSGWQVEEFDFSQEVEVL